jgi:Ca2+-dependent lipid-binding protein
METKFILVNNINESLMLNLYDFNDHRKNTLLGTATFDLPKLIEDSSHEGIESPLLKDGKDRGNLRYDIIYYPTLETPQGSTEVPQSSMYLNPILVT